MWSLVIVYEKVYLSMIETVYGWSLFEEKTLSSLNNLILCIKNKETASYGFLILKSLKAPSNHTNKKNVGFMISTK